MFPGAIAEHGGTLNDRVNQPAETVLQHGHLPTLGRAELVAYDEPDGSISFVGDGSVEGLLREWW